MSRGSHHLSPAGRGDLNVGADRGKQRSAPAQPGNSRLELPAIEPRDGMGFRGGKVELKCDRLGIGEESITQLLVEQRSAKQFRQLPAWRGSGFGIQLLSCSLRVQMPFTKWPGSRRSVSDAQRRIACAASTAFTFGIVPPQHAKRESSVSPPMARRAASINRSSDRSAKKIFRTAFSRRALSLSPISPAAEACSIQYSTSTIGTVIG